MRFVNFFDQLPRNYVIAWATFFVATVGLIDYLTGTEVLVSIFYLLPVALVTWYVNRATGIIFSLVSAIMWLLADFGGGHIYFHPFIGIWNAIEACCLFLLVVMILANMKKAFQQLNEMARKDPLTGVLNTRAFYEAAENEISRAGRYQRPLSLAYIDVDDFKTVNDSLGHAAGDSLLTQAASSMMHAVRGSDEVARVGGDEFVILLPEIGAEAALKAVSRLREVLLRDMGKHLMPVTFSIGLVTFLSPPGSVGEMMNAADRLMYSGKNSGKNKVVQQVVGQALDRDASETR